MKKVKPSKIISVVIRIAIVTALLLWVLSRQDIRRFGQVMRQINLWAAFTALGAFVFSQFLVALRWWLLLKSQDIKIAYLMAVKLHFMGLFYNNVLPSSVGGDVLRAWYATKHTEHKFRAFLSVVADRFIGILCVIGTAAVVYIYAITTNSGLDGITLKFDADISKLLLLLGITAATAAVSASLMWMIPSGRKLLGRIYDKFLQTFGKIFLAFKLYISRPGILISAFILTFACQAITLLGFWIFGYYLGVDASVKYYFIFYPISWLMGALPISPGGAGVAEGGLVFLFTRLATVTAEQALALALCQRAVWLISAIPGAFIHLAGAHLPTKEDIRLQISEETPR